MFAFVSKKTLQGRTEFHMNTTRIVKRALFALALATTTILASGSCGIFSIFGKLFKGLGS